MDYGIFNVGTDVNACDCTRECTDTIRESALKDNWEKNPLPHRGFEPASAAFWSDALPVEKHPHQSSPVTDVTYTITLLTECVMCSEE